MLVRHITHNQLPTAGGASQPLSNALPCAPKAMTGTSSAPASSATLTNPRRRFSTKSRQPRCRWSGGAVLASAGAARHSSSSSSSGGDGSCRTAGTDATRPSALAFVYSDSAAPPTARNTADPGPARRRARSVALPSKRRGCSRMMHRPRALALLHHASCAHMGCCNQPVDLQCNATITAPPVGPPVNIAQAVQQADLATERHTQVEVQHACSTGMWQIQGGVQAAAQHLPKPAPAAGGGTT